MGIFKTRRAKVAASPIVTVVVAALSVPLFNWSSVQAANTVTGVNTLVSVSSSGGSSGANMPSYMQATSEDGNVVLFSTNATNLAAPAPNNPQVTGPFVRNISAGTTVRADTSASGVIGDGITKASVLSRNGRYVALASTDTNLIDGTTINPNYKFLTYIKDLQTGAIQLLSNTNDPNPSGSTAIEVFAISDDGRFVFVNTKYASSYIAGARSGYNDVLMFDRIKNTWSQIDNPINGSLQNLDNLGFSASCDGSVLVFQSAATNLSAGYSGSGTHFYLADMRNGITTSDLTAGTTLANTSPSISCNGRYVTFWTKDRTLVSPTPAGLSIDYHAVRYDRLTGQYLYVDSDSSGNFSASPTTMDAIPVSDKGDVAVSYSTWDSYLHVYKTNVYLKHLSDGSNTLETFQVNPTTQTRYPFDGYLYRVRISADSKYLVYSTDSAGLIGVMTSGGNGEIVRTTTGL